MSKLTGNQLKILALVFMTADHVGVQLFPKLLFLRIIGRLAFPIFAYMLAEGCRYTKNRRRHFGVLALTAAVCQVVYSLATGSLHQNILVTFILSAVLIYAFDSVMQKRRCISVCFALVLLLAVVFLTDGLPHLLQGTNYRVDYGIWGVLLPVFIYIGKSKYEKIAFCAIGLLLLSCSIGGMQWYSMLALPLLAFYNGKRGKRHMKYFFYIYYPVHLVVLHFVSLWI